MKNGERSILLGSLLIFLSFSFYSIHSATYYVADSGSDQNDGKTPGAAFATLSWAKTKLKSRDTLLIKRGDIFRDTLNCSALADLVLGSFGPADEPKPVISGSAAISQWSVHNGSVWVAPCDKKIANLFANNSVMKLARYPDTGWLRIDTMTEDTDGANTTIQVTALTKHPKNAAGYWNNAQIRWRRWSWWFETRRIVSYDPSGKLWLEGKSIIHIMGTKGWGFYIDNKFEELNAPGEWFYDSAAGKIYFYPPDGKDPNTMLIEGSYLSYGVSLAGGSVDNICFRHQTLHGLSMSKTSYVSSCRFEGIGSDQGGSALRATWDIANSHIAGNVFANNFNIGISWYENSGRKGTSIIEYDTLLNTGTFPGYGGSGTWHAVGILVHLTSNARVQYNYIDKTGYAGILLGSDSNFVQYNIIKNAMATLNDGAAIYTDCSKSFIRNNIIYDTRGDLVSSGPWYPLGHGIWLEFLGKYRESVVENNTIVQSGCYGIYLPNNFSCMIKNNTLFDNAIAQLKLDGEVSNHRSDQTRTIPQNNQFIGNVCYSTTRQQKSLLFRPEYNYGTMQANYFCNPYTDSVVSGYGTGTNKWTIYNYTFGQWKTLFPAWADNAPKTDPFKRPPGINENNPYGKGRIFINESPVQKDFSLGPTLYKDLEGNTITGSLSVPPYSSRILVQADSSAGILTNLSKNAGILLKKGNAFVQYRLIKRSSVTFILYSLSGREIFRLSRSTEEPGTYTIAFTVGTTLGQHLASGVYNYVFSTSWEGKMSSSAGKFILMR